MANVRPVSYFVVFAVLTGFLSAPLDAAEWANWRGPNENGYVDASGLPSSWSPAGENLVWKADIGGRSTPVIVAGRACIITLGNPEEKPKWQELISCFDAETGKLLWDYSSNIFQTDIPHHRVGWASLVADEETGNVYSHGISGMLTALDPKGKVVWRRSMDEETGRFSGFGGRTVTPMIDGDLLIVSFLQAGWGGNFIPRHRFYALDKKTGETVWISTPGGAPFDTTYSTGVVAVINGERLLIDGNADGGIYAIRVATGEKVWGFPLSKRGINSSVVIDGTLVYASHSEENVDGSTAMGRLVCLDASKVTDGKPAEVWKVDGFAAGYATPTIHSGVLYQVDNSANLVAFDGKTGKQLWKHNLGIAQRSSPVLADGKIYASDVDGKFQVLKLGDREPEVLDVEEFKMPDGSAVQINGSPAIANGKVYLLTGTAFYAIGSKASANAPAKATPAISNKAPAGAQPAHLQVIPAEILLKPGATLMFRARTFDAKGRLIGDVTPQWSVEGIKATVSDSGQFKVADEKIPQGGQVVATLGGLKGGARVNSLPAIPFKQDFEGLSEKAVPSGWSAAQGRYQTVSVDGNKMFYKPSGNPRSWRTTVYFGDPYASKYTIEAEVMGKEAKRRMPDIGLVSHRYTFALMGNRQELMVRSWLSELERFSEVIKYRWDPEVWYHLKFHVEPMGTATKLQGKVWKKGEPEPAEWTIEAVDELGHQEGSPGLYGFSVADVYIDNISVDRP